MFVLLQQPLATNILSGVISICHHYNKYVAIWYCHKHRICGKTTMPTKSRTIAIRYCNNWLLPRKGTRHEVCGVGIGYRHKYISPQMGFLRRFCHLLREAIPTKEVVASSACCHKKNVATCYIFVAIEHFLATFWFLWQ
jgi:hypothetical protein